MADGRAVLLIGFGGPESLAEVRPFLDRVLKGRPVPPHRYEEVVKQYERIGGSSPFNRLTAEMAAGLKEQLKLEGLDVPVRVGLRNTAPYLGDVLQDMLRGGARDIVGVVLSSFISEPSWNRYLAAVDEVIKPMGEAAPRLRYATAWYKEPDYHQVLADRIAEVLEELPPERRDKAEWIFTAHSIPTPADLASRYSQQIAFAAKAAARMLGKEKWRQAYQSRSGRPQDPWLEPDIGEVIRALPAEGVKDVVVIPIGFIVDHVEVLFDLDVKARAAAEESGVGFVRAKTVGLHPLFTRVMSQNIRRVFARDSVKSSMSAPL